MIATGRRPVIPDEVRDVPHHTSDTIMRIDEVPEHLVIVGSGYIAAEFAHVFSAFGARVSMIGRSSLAAAQPGRDGRPSASPAWPANAGTSTSASRSPPPAATGRRSR